MFASDAKIVIFYGTMVLGAIVMMLARPIVLSISYPVPMISVALIFLMVCRGAQSCFDNLLTYVYTGSFQHSPYNW